MNNNNNGHKRGAIIALIQLTSAPESRTYTFYDDVAQCMDGLCQLYEQAIAVKNPRLHNVTYSFDELLGYFQSLSDLSFLVREERQNSNGPGHYAYYNIDWVERQMFHHLRRQANP